MSYKDDYNDRLNNRWTELDIINYMKRKIKEVKSEIEELKSEIEELNKKLKND